MKLTREERANQAERQAAKQRQLDALAEGRKKGASLAPGKVKIPANEPRLTPDLAYELVKLLHAGLPQLQAMAYLVPEYDRGVSKTLRIGWRRRWMNDPLLLDAAKRLNGGEWVSLDAERRLEIALDKHYAELAYFLYTHDYADLEEVDLKKADVAREALAAKLNAAESEGDDAPWTRFVRDLMEGKVAAVRPPQLPATEPATEPGYVPVPVPVRTKGN